LKIKKYIFAQTTTNKNVNGMYVLV